MIIQVPGTTLRGFVKLEQFQKSEKNSEVGGWVNTQHGLYFFLEMLCFLVLFSFFQIFPKKFKN